MQNIRPFQIALLALFAIIGVVSIIFLASFSGFVSTEENVYGDSVIVWGPFDARIMQAVMDEEARTNKSFAVVDYIQKDPRTFEEELVNAIAEGRAPDAVLIPHELLVTLRSKLLPIPYDTFSRRDFLDRFVDGAEIFARPDGIYALPFAVDPLVMYWNRDLLSVAGIATPPSTWESVVSTVVPRVTRLNSNRELVTSAIAFGEYDNSAYAKEILLTLMMQSGSRLVEEEERGYRVVLDDPISPNARPPMNAAVQFYTDFSNANSSLYSWNRAQEFDQTAFLAGDLALYFGYGSDSVRIPERNPNLNFDVAPVPQGASATVKRVYGTFYGLAIVRASQNVPGTYAAIQTLTREDILAGLTEQLALAPSTRTLIGMGSADPYRQVILGTTLVARGWLDPSANESDSIFSQMIDDVVSNRKKVAEAVTDALKRLELIF